MSSLILKGERSLIRQNQFQKDEVTVTDLKLKDNHFIDLSMDDYVKTHLNNEYINIFIPLSFGAIITDFLGLRLAFHIRTAISSVNQNANIFIYGAFTYEEILPQNELHQILNTKGLFLIDACYEELVRCTKYEQKILSVPELKDVLNSLHLKPTDNYYDSHSIANIWGLFSLLALEQIEIKDIKSIHDQTDKLSELHFKLLIAKWRVKEYLEPGNAVNEKLSKPLIINDKESISTSNILLIDDEENKGWTEVLGRILEIPVSNLIAVKNVEDAVRMLKKQTFQLIFLDLRLGERDHHNIDSNTFGGYDLLTKYIRNDFHANNFTTPVILLTASNKAWNITSMIQNGVDDYYIKEHPEQFNDTLFSMENKTRLHQAFTNLIRLGRKRHMIWESLIKLEKLASSAIVNQNIKERIFEKIKIGYGLLFRKTTVVESEKLIFNNEILSFIVFWSILEEISHDFYNRVANDSAEWILRKNGFKVQFIDPKNNNYIQSCFDSVKKDPTIFTPSKKKDSSGQKPLSQQISGILKHQLGWSSARITSDFLEPFNEYRNKIDFIHSDTSSILKNRLKQSENSETGLSKCKDLINFLIIILS